MRRVCGGEGWACAGDRLPAWSPDGKRIAFVRGRDLMVMRPDGGDVRPVARVRPWPRFGPAFSWSPDSRLLAYTCEATNGLCTVEVDGPAEPKQITQPPAPGQWIMADSIAGWSPDGAHIAFLRTAFASRSSRCCQLWVADADGSDPVLLGPDDFLGSPALYSGAEWSPDGRLAFRAGDAVWTSLADGTDRRLVAENAGNASSSPDSRLVFRVGNALWISDSVGTGKRLLHPNVPGAVIGWSSDGERVFVASHTSIWVLSVDDAQPTLTLLAAGPYEEPLGLAQPSPAGDLVSFSLLTPPRIHVVDLNAELQISVPSVSPQAVESPVAWSPDGRTVVYVSDRGCPARLGLYSIGADGRRDTQLTQRCRINGLNRSETLAGTVRTDGIYGRGGADHIRAGDSSDLVHGGVGHDTLDGGRGDDRLYGDRGRDVIRGGLGWDAVVSHDGERDRVSCGPGRDVVWADRRDVVSNDCNLVTRE